jgi:alkyl sulfatase BDS1-like metallo-beta-lactamase superfamily hydrolase
VTQLRARSFEPNDHLTITLPGGQRAHRDHVSQSDRVAKTFYEVRPGVWNFVGNGFSNQSFVEAPDGIIAIDSGESVEEMREAIHELRRHTSKPIVAALYTHFHYVAGTKAIVEETGEVNFPIWGHERIAGNLVRATTEIGPTYARGVIEQFGMFLPDDGPDGLVNAGLGPYWRDAAHAPFSPGFIAPTHTFGDQAVTINVAGLQVDVTPAPSDADDSVTFWFPELGLCVNNAVWPVLFNVFAIRGEEYRDPRVLVKGIEHILGLAPEYLVGAHGPPLTGQADILRRVTVYRDSIQYLWDQAVRASNAGLTSTEVGLSVSLPDAYDADYLTSELYGVAEHHLRQIQMGLFGFFDGDEANLFPLPTPERSARLIDGFGGRAEVRRQMQVAIDGDDLRWALELGSWLARSPEADDTDRLLLATALRRVAERTPAANIRNWCITRARSLDGSLNFKSFYKQRIAEFAVLLSPPSTFVDLLRVMLDPTKIAGINFYVTFEFDGALASGLHIRNSIAAIRTDGQPDATVSTSLATWAKILGGSLTWSAAVAAGELRVRGDESALRRAMAGFEVPGLQA